MSATGFYHPFVPQGYELRDCWEKNGAIRVELRPRRDTLQCGHCGTLKVTIHDSRFRCWKDARYGTTPVFIVMEVPRVLCGRCEGGKKTTHQVTFAEGLRRHTHRFEEFAQEWLQRTTIQDVAIATGLAWDTVAKIDHRRLQQLPKACLKKVRRIGLDEVYVGKRHKFLTIVMDLDRKVVISVEKGRGEQALKPCFEALQQAGAKITAVALDMSGAFYAAVQKHLPKAKCVFDKFHIVKLMNDKLTQLRRELYRELTDQQGKDVLKGTRHLLTRNPQNLTTLGSGPKAVKEADLLESALADNKPLSQAYYLKEDLRQLWSQPTKSDASRFLDSWCRRAESTGIRVLRTMANTLRGYRSAILNWYDAPITTALMEGTNNKIGLLQRRAFGYRNYQHLRLRILNIHHTRSAIIG